MEKPKKTIRKRIFFSHIIIIMIFLFLTVLVFDLCLTIYIRRQARIQLITAGELIKNSMNKKSENLNDVQKLEFSKNIVRNQLKNNSNLKQTLSFFDVNYALLGKNKNLIYPANENNEEYSILSKQLLPLIKRRQLSNIENNKGNVFYLTASAKRYAVLMYPLENANNSTGGYLTIYTDLSRSRKLTMAVNMMLFSILLITAAIALIISNNVSEKISRPISALNKYAKSIGEREYNTELVKHENDEIGNLAETMYSMAQKLSAYDSTIKTFMQNASHELRTPLMSIQGYAEAIKYRVIEDEDKAVDIIMEESKRLSELVEDLLYLSKIDSLQEEFNFEKIKIEDVIRSSIERVNGIAVKNEKIIRFSHDSNNLMVVGDEEKLIRAAINILGNCLRYCNNCINVNLKKELSNIIITIEDDGPGFDAKDLGNIFDRFYKGKGGNYGLGLAITKSIIEKHGGRIAAENNIKGGACFKISFEEKKE